MVNKTATGVLSTSFILLGCFQWKKLVDTVTAPHCQERPREGHGRVGPDRIWSKPNLDQKFRIRPAVGLDRVWPELVFNVLTKFGQHRMWQEFFVLVF